jgi:hypothetical protein
VLLILGTAFLFVRYVNEVLVSSPRGGTAGFEEIKCTGLCINFCTYVDGSFFELLQLYIK